MSKGMHVLVETVDGHAFTGVITEKFSSEAGVFDGIVKHPEYGEVMVEGPVRGSTCVSILPLFD